MLVQQRRRLERVGLQERLHVARGGRPQLVEQRPRFVEASLRSASADRPTGRRPADTAGSIVVDHDNFQGVGVFPSPAQRLSTSSRSRSKVLRVTAPRSARDIARVEAPAFASPNRRAGRGRWSGDGGRARVHDRLQAGAHVLLGPGSP